MPKSSFYRNTPLSRDILIHISSGWPSSMIGPTDSLRYLQIGGVDSPHL